MISNSDSVVPSNFVASSQEACILVERKTHICKSLLSFLTCFILDLKIQVEKMWRKCGPFSKFATSLVCVFQFLVLNGVPSASWPSLAATFKIVFLCVMVQLTVDSWNAGYVCRGLYGLHCPRLRHVALASCNGDDALSKPFPYFNVVLYFFLCMWGLRARLK